ncbi:MAG: radical SAM protein [Candidatus Babeliales bacterium]|jgi:MoaA/NifB/PqqE/SkfB family radical SAM enzyme
MNNVNTFVTTALLSVAVLQDINAMHTIPISHRTSQALIATTGLRRFSAQATINNCKSPETVDFNINGICNLNCKWCWGPAHDAKEDVTLSEWKNLAYNLKKLGTKNIVFTGGETLLKKELPELARYINTELELRTTLSSNGLLLVKRGPSVLPYINDLGLPLDGHTIKVNSTMRKGTILHFSKVLAAIKFVQNVFPNIKLTVRTVAAMPNLDSVPLIGKTMLESGIDPKTLRWKIYQVSPVGPRKEDILNSDLLITRKDFDETIEITKKMNPLFTIDAQPYERSFGRYFHVFPDGKSHIVTQGTDGLPLEVPMGNIVKDFDKVIKNVNEVFNFDQNCKHGSI